MVATSRNPDQASSGTLYQLLAYAMDQRLKLLNTCLPGIVHRYDSATGRADIQPLIDLLLADERRLEPPMIADVPILQPGVAGYYVHLPVAKDDTVWIMCSQRGIEEFKETVRRSAPDREGLHSLKDAVAIPVLFRRPGPPPTDGLVLSTREGTDYLSIKPGDWKLLHSGTITIEGPQDTLILR